MSTSTSVLKRSARWMIVTVGALVLTTLSINAFDGRSQLASSLFGAALLGTEYRVCPKDMAFVSTSDGGFCIDTYEAAAAASCVHAAPRTHDETRDNISLQSCTAVSQPHKQPWTHLSREEAELLCARTGKRLPTNEEWYRAALATPDKNSGWTKDDCNVNSSGPRATGAQASCISSAGVYDMIGNVWEWQSETVRDGLYRGVALPDGGYVVSIDEHGVPLETGSDEAAALFGDYFWVNQDGVRGMFRGGYWRSFSDAGQYALNVTVPPSFVGAAIGFRCVKDVSERP